MGTLARYHIRETCPPDHLGMDGTRVYALDTGTVMVRASGKWVVDEAAIQRLDDRMDEIDREWR